MTISDSRPSKEPARVDLLIDGQWRPAAGDARLEVRNPATGELVALAAAAQPSDLEAAAQSANRGFEIWRDVPGLERGKVLRAAAAGLRRRAGEIGRWITLENGKTLADSEGEVHWAADFFEWYAEEARRTYGRVIPARTPGVMQFVVREPIGPVLALGTWNGPLVVIARKIAPALAAGCSVIAKAAEECPSAVAAMAAELMDAGLPPGVLNVVQGDPGTISRILISHSAIRKISFTGSANVGRLLARQAGEYLKPITLELGGHAPVIVCADADIESFVKKLMPVKFRSAGQICSSPSRFFVHESIHDEFVRQVAAAASALSVGNGLDASSQVGPLIGTRRLSEVQRLIRNAVDNGAKIVTGGRRIGDHGCFFQPTVLDDVSDECAIMNEEPFGPLISISAFSGYAEVVRRANRLAYGLAAYVFTRSIETSRKLTHRLECGLVGVNTFVVSMAEAPFGGVKESGYGKEGGTEGIASFTIEKFVAESS